MVRKGPITPEEPSQVLRTTVEEYMVWYAASLMAAFVLGFLGAAVLSASARGTEFMDKA